MTVVTDVVAKLRADTSDFTRGMKTAEASVRRLENAANSASTTTHRSAGNIFSSAGSIRSSFQSAANSASAGAVSVTASTTSMSRGFENASVSATRMGSSIVRLRDAQGRFVSAGREAETAANGIGSSMDGAAASVLGNVSSMRGGLMGLAVGAGVAAVAVGGALAMMTVKGVQAAASYEQTSIAFESSFKSMGRSAEDAQQYLSNLRDFAAKTPFTLTGLLNSVRGLIAVGNSPEKVITQMLPAIGDMASMMGVGEDAIAGVVFAMRQMTGSPRVLAQDLYQVQNALPGFNAKMALAKDRILALKAGFKPGNMAEFQKAIEDGAITGKDAVDALIRGMQKFPGAAGMMEKQSMTLNGVLSTFQDTVNNALIDGFKPAIPAIAGALNKLMPVVQNFVVGFGNAMGDELPKAINAVVPALTTLSEKAGPMLGMMIRDIVPVLAPFVELLARGAMIVGGVFLAAFNSLKPTLMIVVSGISQMFDALTPVIASLYTLGQSAGGANSTLRPMMSILVQIVRLLAPWVAILLQGIAALLRLTNAVTGLLRPLVALGATALSSRRVIETNMSAVITVIQKVGFAFGFLQSLASQVFPKITSAATAGAKALVSVWNNQISKWVSVVGNAIRSVLGLFGGIIGKLYKAAVSAIASLVGGLVDGLNKYMPQFMKDMIGFTKSAVAQAGRAGAVTSYEWGAVAGEQFSTGWNNNLKIQVPGKDGRITTSAARQPYKAPPPLPGTGMDTGGGAPTTGAGGGAAAGSAAQKAFETMAQLSAAIRKFASDNKITGSEITSLSNRSKDLFAQFGLSFQQGTNIIRAALKGLTDGTKITVGELSKAFNTIHASFSGVKSAVDKVKESFARFKDLSLRAFDGETAKLVQNIRDQYSGLAAGIANNLKQITADFNAAVKTAQTTRDNAITAATGARETAYAAAEKKRAALTPAEQAMKDLQEQSNVENLQRSKMQAEQALADAMKIRNTKKRNEAIQAAQQQLNEALRAIQLDALQKQAEVERAAADTQYTQEISDADKIYQAAVEDADRTYNLAVESAQNIYDQQVADNKRQEEEAVRNLEFNREQERLSYEKALTNLETLLTTKGAKWKGWKATLDKFLNDPTFKGLLERSGVNLGTAFADGLKKAKDNVRSAITVLVDLVKKYMELHSPAKMGPMSDLDQWWKPFGKTLIGGIDERDFARKLSKSLTSIPLNVGTSFGVNPPKDVYSIMPISDKPTTSPPVTININVSGSVIQERDLAETVREELMKVGRRDGTIFGGII